MQMGLTVRQVRFFKKEDFLMEAGSSPRIICLASFLGDTASSKNQRCTNAVSNVSRTLSRVGNVIIPATSNNRADAAFSQYIG